jgi:hypothetical protein
MMENIAVKIQNLEGYLRTNGYKPGTKTKGSYLCPAELHAVVLGDRSISQQTFRNGAWSINLRRRYGGIEFGFQDDLMSVFLRTKEAGSEKVRLNTIKLCNCTREPKKKIEDKDDDDAEEYCVTLLSWGKGGRATIECSCGKRKLLVDRKVIQICDCGERHSLKDWDDFKNMK